jgi:hypothetical protein
VARLFVLLARRQLLLEPAGTVEDPDTRSMQKLTALSKLLISAILIGSGITAFQTYGSLLEVSPEPSTANKAGAVSSAVNAPAPSARSASAATRPPASKDRPVRVALSQWPGHMALVVGAGGLRTQPGSIAASEGLDVEIVFIEDAPSKNRALQTGDVDFVWETVDELPIALSSFAARRFEVMTTATAPSYVSTAFYSQYNVILLGGSALFALASASPLPLAVGIVGELLWLSLGPRLPAFRRHVDRLADGERRARLDDQLMQGIHGLAPVHAARLLAVGQSISWIVMNAEASATGAAERAALGELDGLRAGFLRLCQLRERLGQRLEELRLAPPEHEVARLSRAYAAEKDLGLRFTLHQAIKLAQRKIEQQAQLVDAQRQVELKLSLLEQSLVHLKNQQQLGLAGPELARDIQGIVSHAGGLAALEAELGAA